MRPIRVYVTALVLAELAREGPSPITPRKTSPTISMPVMTCLPSEAASASNASIGASLTHAGARGARARARLRRRRPPCVRAASSSAGRARARTSGLAAEQGSRGGPGLPVSRAPLGPELGAERDQLGEVGDRVDVARAPRRGRARARRGSRRAGAPCRGRPARTGAAGRSAAGSPRRSSPGRAHSARSAERGEHGRAHARPRG